MKKKGFTLIELLVVIAIIAMLMAILMPALSKVKKIASRVVCGTNLKGLGTAQTVYANDYDDEYTVQGGGANLTWANSTDSWNDDTIPWSSRTNISIGASLYLLVREADVSPKSFVCPSSDQEEWNAKTAAAGAADVPDIVDVYDFGHPNWENQGAENCVSYSYHVPYDIAGSVTGKKNRYAADGTRSAAFAVMADQNPFFSKLLTNGTASADNWLESVGVMTPDHEEKWRRQCNNTQPHDRESQNVLFADGHTSNERLTNVGVRDDGIYTRWPSTTATYEQQQQGQYPSAGLTDFAPQGLTDSVLINDTLPADFL